MKKHLRRLERIFSRTPVFFITTTAINRQRVLSSDSLQGICEEVWRNVEDRYDWSVGPYVIMPDHVHFFYRQSSEDASALSTAVGKWKEWTAKYANRRLNIDVPLWQPEFFDHAMRSEESMREKVAYVWQNPVRAGLVDEPEHWPYRGNPGNWATL